MGLLENLRLWKGKASLRPKPNPFLQQASGQIFKDGVKGFSSTFDITFMDLNI